MLRNFYKPLIFTAILLASLTTAANGQRKPAVAQSGALVSRTANPAMTAAWNSGQLPQPMPIPSDDPDDAIAILAHKVAARNEESVPAFLTALQMSGFFVTKQDGSVFLAPADNKGQGLTINGWEVASSAKMFGDGKSTTLSELDRVLTSIPVLRDSQPTTLLMQGIRTHADNSQNKFLRCWARFILEMGKTDANDKINAIQHLLIFRRLYGDLYSRGLPYQMGLTGQLPVKQNRRLPRTYGAAFSPESSTILGSDHSDFQLSASTDQREVPCRMDGNAPTIMDASAGLIGFGYGEMLGHLEEKFAGTPTGAALEKAGKFHALANIILAYAKFIQSYGSLETVLKIDHASKLIRTRDTRPGEQKNLSATVRMNIGNWQMYNCIRLVMNQSSGLDFATLNDGPIGDVGVTWHLDKGGELDEYSNRTGVNASAEQIVGFSQEGAIRIQDKGTSFANAPNVRYGKTDTNGVAKVQLVGSPQKNFKKFKVRPVMKEAVVRTTIKLKAGEIKGDLVDVSGQAIGGITGLITMPAELLYRVSWASSGTLNVPVQDWEDCTGGWSGTISIKRRSNEWKRNPQEKGVIGYSESTTSRKYEYDGEARFDNAVAQRSGQSGMFVLLKAGSNATSKIVWEDTSLHTYRNNCGKVTTTRTLFKSTRREESGTGRGTAEGELAFDLSNNTYRFHISIPAIPGKTKDVDLLRPSGYCRPQDNEEKTDTNEWSTEIGSMPIEISDGLIDPNNPDLIEGSRAFTDAGGDEVEIRWSFTNCR